MAGKRTGGYAGLVRAGEGRPHAQVHDGIRGRIEAGTLLPGDRVPTVRGLAADLGLAPNTVARAYRELEEEGWLVGRGRAGTFVAERLPELPSNAEVALAEAARAFARRVEQLGFTVEDAVRALREGCEPSQRARAWRAGPGRDTGL
jgi:DNA-binding transcriptional regulator YhcF (GntR family)